MSTLLQGFVLCEEQFYMAFVLNAIVLFTQCSGLILLRILNNQGIICIKLCYVNLATCLTSGLLWDCLIWCY